MAPPQDHDDPPPAPDDPPVIDLGVLPAAGEEDAPSEPPSVPEPPGPRWATLLAVIVVTAVVAIAGTLTVQHLLERRTGAQWPTDREELRAWVLDGRPDGYREGMPRLMLTGPDGGDDVAGIVAPGTYAVSARCGMLGLDPGDYTTTMVRLQTTGGEYNVNLPCSSETVTLEFPLIFADTGAVRMRNPFGSRAITGPWCLAFWLVPTAGETE